MVSLFGVDPELVTYEVRTTTIFERQSVIVTYSYNNIDRIEVTLFGCLSDDVICARKYSGIECAQYINKYVVTWE